MQTSYFFILIVSCLAVFSNCALGKPEPQISVILKWGSYPGSIDTHELFLRNGEVLSIVRKEGGSEKMPNWKFTKIDREVERSVIIKIDEAIRVSNESEGRKNCHRNDALQWGVKYNSTASKVLYGNKCDTETVYKIITEILLLVFPTAKESDQLEK